jgi:hypothetical protein
MARKKCYSKRVFANIRVSSVKKRGGVEYLKRYVYTFTPVLRGHLWEKEKVVF